MSRKSGMSRDDLFGVNVGIVCILCEGVVKMCLNVIVNIIFNFVNLMVFIVVEVFKNYGCYDVCKFLGVMYFDVMRAKMFVVVVKGFDDLILVDVLVIGGYVGMMILLLLF